LGWQQWFSVRLTLAFADNAPQGSGPITVAANPLTPAQQQRLAAKDAFRRSQLTPGSMKPYATTAAMPTNGWLKASPANNYEGQGNFNKTYTCGPASSRNMIQDLTGHDYGEYQFEVWEGTSSSTGTPAGNIRNAFNNHFAGYDTWALYAPTSGYDLANTIGASVWYARHGIILNVATQYLSFWSGHAARHYDYGYGWDKSGATAVNIAEEWSGRTGTYGYHREPGSNAYNAVHFSPSGTVVW
jgi:hypothetical protein